MCLPANSQTNRLFHPTKPLFSPAKPQFNGVAGWPDLRFASSSPTAIIPHAGSYSCQADGLAQPHPASPTRASGCRPSLYLNASSGGGGTNMSIDGTWTECLVESDPVTFPDRRQLAPARKKPGASYLDVVRRFSMLERDQEYMLAKRWREHGDRDAANQLVTSHLRLAVKVAMSYRGYGLPVSEIISEGNVGLLQALNRFDPERGFRFSTYAIWWIRASIQDY